MTFRAYLWRLVRHSSHRTLRVLELGEAIVGMTVYCVGFFVPEWFAPLKVLFVMLLGALFLTFMLGLLLAAYASDREAEDVAQKNQRAADAQLATLQQQLQEERDRHPVEKAKDQRIHELANDLQQLKAELDRRSPSAANLEIARRQVARLSREQRQVLRVILDCTQMTDIHIQDYCNTNNLGRVTGADLQLSLTFINRGGVGGELWSVQPEMRGAVDQALQEHWD